MQFYTTLSDLATYSTVEGSAVFSVNDDNEIRVYDITAIIQHLQETNQLDRFLIESELDDDILYDLDSDGPLTQVLIDGTREELVLE